MYFTCPLGYWSLFPLSQEICLSVNAPHNIMYNTCQQALKFLVFLSCSPKPKIKDSTQASNGQRNSSSENLIQLYKRLVALKDSNLLQRIADILETTGRFELTETTLDFDLCSLDKTTIKKIESSINRWSKWNPSFVVMWCHGVYIQVLCHISVWKYNTRGLKVQ